MAEIRKITPRAALSDFRQVTPQAGGVFRALAATAQTAYDYLEPRAKEEMKQAGSADGHEMSGGINYGNNGVSKSSSGGGTFREALKQSESGGRSDVVNSEGFGGLYQWGQPRLDDYNRATGQSITMEQFLGNAAIQEGAQDWHEKDIMSSLGKYVGTTVNGQVMDEAALIAMAHLGGTGGARKYVESGGAYNPADSNGTSLSDYAAKFGGKGTVTKSSSDAPQPTTVRTKDGKLESRLFSPSAGPILQAYNAAAGVAYVSDKMMQASIDMMNLSNEFELDPEGFMAAAQGYMDGVAEDAPDLFREEVRSQVEREAQRRFLGMMEEKQSDISQRAANSSQALIERWSDDYVDALASGNMSEAAAAEDQLRGLLSARESLPGLSWTPEQSENVVIKSRERAEVAKREAQKKVNDEYTDKLKLVIKAKEEGLDTAFDSIIDDPAAEAANPEVYREAVAKSFFKDALPSFTASSPAERAAAITDLEANPISEEYQIDILKAARDADAKVRTDFAEDPIAAATKYLPAPPPPLTLDFADPAKAAASLTARADYARALVEAGHTDRAVFVSKEEAKAAGELFGKDVPPPLKAAAAGAIVAAMGSDAEGFFKQISTTDPVIKHAGMMMARGGDPVVATEAMTGQSLLDQGVADAPPPSAVSGGFTPEIQTALAAAPGALSNLEGVRETAIAIYAARLPAGADERTQKEVMAGAWNAALGQTETLGKKTGGVQTVAGQPVLLPPKVAGEDLDKAMSMAAGAGDAPWLGFGVGTFMAPASRDDMWVEASGGSMPTLGGKPLPSSVFEDGEVSLTPVGGNRYMLSILRNGVTIDVAADGDPNKPFIFDVDALITASRKAP